MQQWLGYSDPDMEEALHDIALLRRSAGLDTFENVMPNERTVLCLRYFLGQHDLATAIFGEVAGVLSEKGLTMKWGKAGGGTLVAAPSSAKNQD